MYNSVFFCASVFRDKVEAISNPFVKEIWAHEKGKKKLSSINWQAMLQTYGKNYIRHVSKVKKNLGDTFASEEMELINKYD